MSVSLAAKLFHSVWTCTDQQQPASPESQHHYRLRLVSFLQIKGNKKASTTNRNKPPFPIPFLMRHLHDLHDSAAPSPIVPTARTRPPSKEKPLFFYDMPALARNLYSVANSEADSKPLRLLGIISDDVADGHKKDDDVAADLIRRLQSQSPASASASASASTSSLLTSTASGTGAREMFKAGHRRLRQLAQRQRKDIDSDARADEEARQLSALQREGLLPAPAVSDGGGPRRPRAKKESFDFPTTTAITPSCSNTSFQQSNSRRDVERIGQPWLGDPLERCMLDPLSSGERLSSLDLGDLASFMDTTTSLDSRLDDTKPQRSPAQEIPVEVASQHPATIDSHEHAPQLLSETKPQAQTATSETPHSDLTESTDKGKAHTNERAPRPSQNLKLFPDSLPPRVSSKATWRRSKCPPVSNGAQPAAAGSQHALPPLAEMPSPVLKQSDNKEPRSAPASTGQFADTEEKPENQDCDQKNPDRPSSLPMHAINSFPLPAPTRPLPALPESVSSTTAHTAKANPKKSGRASPSPLGFRAAVNPPPLRKGSPRSNSTELARPHPLVQHEPSSGSRVGDLVAALDSTGADDSREENVRASRCSGMSTHLQVTSRSFEAPRPQEAPSSNDSRETKRRSVEFNLHPVQKDAPPRSPSSASSPPLFPSQPVRPSNWHPAGRTLPSTQINPTSTPAPRPSSQIRRSNSYREESRSEPKRELRSEYPIPSSDEEGIDLRTHNPGESHAQKKRRRTKPNRTSYHDSRLSHGSGIEKPAMDTLSPENASSSSSSSSHNFGSSSPLSQYSQNAFHSHGNSHTLTTLKGRITQLERQNRILQAALLAALEVGNNSNNNKESSESLLSGTVASMLSAPSSKTTPTSSLADREPPSETGGYSSSHRTKDNTHPSRRRDTWLDLDTCSRSSSDGGSSNAQSSNLSAKDKALEGINDVDFGWLSNRSSLVH